MLGVAGVCRTHIPKPFSFLRIAQRCRALRPRWCQSGVKTPQRRGSGATGSPKLPTGSFAASRSTSRAPDLRRTYPHLPRFARLRHPQCSDRYQAPRSCQDTPLLEVVAGEPHGYVDQVALSIAPFVPLPSSVSSQTTLSTLLAAPVRRRGRCPSPLPKHHLPFEVRHQPLE